MKKKLILFLAFICMGLNAQIKPNWIRYQSISPDGRHIAFTFKGDLYRVASSGGEAVQLTFHQAHDYMPVWSNDSKHIAFASDRYGNFDVFLMDVLGGPATRLTFHSNDEKPFSFSHDNKHVIFGGQRQDKATHRQYPTAVQPELYKVPASGGRITQVFTIPAEHVQTSNNGLFMVYHDKKGGENEWRKHHKSSITRDIWLYDSRNDTHKMLTNREVEDRQPVFSANEKSIYYLSEQNGTFNIHKMSVENPAQDQQLTYFHLHPVRFLSFGSGTLCFGYDGEIYTMQEGGQPQRVNVSIRTQDKANPDKYLTINGGVREMAIAPNGKEIAFIARGEVFVTSVDGALTKRITNTPGQERFVTWGPEGKSVVYAAERNGKWNVYKATRVREAEEPFFFAATLIKEEGLLNTTEDNYMPQYSPDGEKLAFIAGRRTLRVMDVASGKTTDLLTPNDLFHMRDGDKYFRWSPDSQWLLIDWGLSLNNSEVLLMAADGSRRVNLTESGYYDSYPKWVNEGKQMIWFSNRNGLKSYATSGRSQRDVYAMFFTQDAWDKYSMSKEDYELMQAIEEEKETDKADEEEKNKKKEKEEKLLAFDWDGLKERKARFTIHSSNLGDATLSKDGEKLYYLASFEKGQNLWMTNLRPQETKLAIAMG